jgi:hypothetical protein
MCGSIRAYGGEPGAQGGAGAGTLVIHRRGSPEPVESESVRIKRSMLEEMAGAVQRVLARSTPFTH